MLISEPTLADSYFKRSVIVLTEHGENGSVGFILNKKTEMKLSQAIEEFSEFDFPIYFGGPVKRDNLFFIHTLGSLVPESHEIYEGLFWGGNFEELKKLILSGKVKKEQVKSFKEFKNEKS